MAWGRGGFGAFVALVLCCLFLQGCGGKPRPELVLADRSEEVTPPCVRSSDPQPSADAPAPAEKKDAWFFLSPREGNTAHRGAFDTDLPDQTVLYAEFSIAPLGGRVTRTAELTVLDGALSYDFSSFVPAADSAISPQWAKLTLTLRFRDPQPKELTDAFGQTGQFLTEGFLAGQGLAARVTAQFALPFPEEASLADSVPPTHENPTDLVFASSRRYHRQSCRYAPSAQPVALGYAQSLGLTPCALCGP